MAKKFVRGITDIKNIEHQDFDTNNVNDLLSDGKHNYIHRKKEDGSEEYHNLTNNLKILEAVENGLLTVTNNNNTTNSAELEVHHDGWKSQALNSPDNTIEVHNGENGTMEFTTVDVNFDKVQSKLTAGAGIELNNNIISVSHSEEAEVILNNVVTTQFLKPGFNSLNLPQGASPDGLLTVVRISDVVEQTYQTYDGNGRFFRTCFQVDTNPHWSDWKKINTSDPEVVLYKNPQTYTHQNATLKTHVKSVANSSSVSTVEEEFNFIAKMNKGETTASFTLSEHDTAVFEYLIDTYGDNGTVVISTCMFSLQGSFLTFMCNDDTTTNHPYVISFSDIKPSPSTNSQQQAPSVEKTDEIADKTVVTDKEQETE